MTFTAIINACTTTLNWEIALEIYNSLTDEIKDEMYLLAAIFECMIKNNQHEKADAYLKIMKSKRGEDFEFKYKCDSLPA